MSDLPVVAFLPCRRGSQRIPDKNTRPFAGCQEGLIGRKLRQLLAVSRIERIVVSTDDPIVANMARTLGHKSPGRITVADRPAHLATSATSTDALIQHVPEVIHDALILWTHVTSPFTVCQVYDEALQRYHQGVTLSGEFDSLMTVTPLRSFIWSDQGPVNYDRSQEKWPQTQRLNPLLEVNSAVFLATREIYVEHGDRIGQRPLLMELDPITSLDVDWPHDFELAERMATASPSADRQAV